MNIQQPEPSPSEASADTTRTGKHTHDEVTSTASPRLDAIRRLRGLARSLTLTALVAVMAVALTACGSSTNDTVDTVDTAARTSAEDSTQSDEDQNDLENETDESQYDQDETELEQELEDGQSEEETDSDVQIPAPPSELVGTWHNDPSGVDWYLTIAEDGVYTLTSADLGVNDEGYVDATTGKLLLVSFSGDNRAAAVVVDPYGCDWDVSSWELYGYTTVEVQFCNRGAWVMA